MEDQGKIYLSKHKIRWSKGELRCNGKRISIEEVIARLMQAYPWLTPDTAKVAIYSDVSLTKNAKNANEEVYRKKEQEIRKIRADADFLKATVARHELKNREKQERELRKKESQREKQLKEAMEVIPESIGLQFYQRMNTDLVICALQAKYSELTTNDCRRVIGNWVLKGL